MLPFQNRCTSQCMFPLFSVHKEKQKQRRECVLEGLFWKEDGSYIYQNSSNDTRCIFQMEIKFTYHVKLYSSVVLVYKQGCATIVTNSRTLHHSVRKPHTPPIPLLPSTPAASNLLSVWMDLPVWYISYKWNPTKCGLLCLASVI